MSPSAASTPLPTLPAAPPPPPVFGQNPQGQKPGKKSATPTFLGTQAVPDSTSSQGKQLVGA
jgi:hypothetical protein